MKILFVNSQKFDYGQDLAYAGLCEVLGKENVRDYPRHTTYHLNTKTYPKNLGYYPNYNPLTYVQSQQITPKNCDVVIVGACKPDAFHAYLKIASGISNSTPVVLIDGGDREEMGGDLLRLNAYSLWEEAVRLRPFDIIFKREYLKDRDYAPNIHPLPFSINLNALGVRPSGVFDKDVSFWAMESHPIRSRALELLKGKFDCDENGTAKNQTLKGYKFKGRRYHEELAKCRIVLSLRGGGWDTLRYWEIPALGPLMITQRLGIVIPNDFESGKHIIHCQDDLSDLIDLCEHFLRHEDERVRMASAAYEHLCRYHTHVARARYMIEIIRS